ncbi:MAG: arylesterase [Cyclobacteriaceae bacterium]
MKNQFSFALIWALCSILLMNCGPNKKEDKASQISSSKEEEASERKLILFFGNSLTAGYGIEEEDAFPDLIQNKLDSLEMDYQVINAGLSGETTASGFNRLDWFLEDRPDVFILELGANDGLRGIPLNETRKNLNAIIEKVQSTYPETKILLAGMQIPPNMGQDYTESFRAMYEEIAKQNQNKVFLIPFLLEGVAGNPELNLPDGIHPTEEGHEIVAENIWSYLEPFL